MDEINSLYEMLNSRDIKDVNLGINILHQLKTFQHRKIKNKLINTSESFWVYYNRDGVRKLWRNVNKEYIELRQISKKGRLRCTRNTF